ncbi:MAG: hypothetical protein ACLS9T_08260 [Streptococcus salivarius]
MTTVHEALDFAASNVAELANGTVLAGHRVQAGQLILQMPVKFLQLLTT